MLSNFKQTRIMTNKEQKWYSENQTLFHKILGCRSLLYHTRVSYYYYLKRLLNLWVESFTELFKLNLLPIILKIIVTPLEVIFLLMIPFGAAMRKKFHKEVWEKLEQKKIVEECRRCEIERKRYFRDDGDLTAEGWQQAIKEHEEK